MAKKSDFTDQEWQTLRESPLAVMLAVASAGASGLFGSLKEAFAPASAIVGAAQGKNELLKSVCARDELKAAQQSLRKTIKTIPKGGIDEVRKELQNLAADKASQSTAILKRKATVDDLDAFRSLLVDIADRTAKAAKEGDFIGFGGEWISEGERTAINRISQALEVQTS